MKKSVKVFILLLAVAICSMPLSLDARKSSRSSSGMRSGVVHKINASQFKRLVANYDYCSYCFKGKRPAIIDFSAEWCGWCKKMSPNLAQVAREYAGDIDFYVIDCDKNKSLAQNYNIDGYPKLLVFSMTHHKWFKGYRDLSELRSICYWALGYN